MLKGFKTAFDWRWDRSNTSHTHTKKARNKPSSNTWTGKIFTATYSLISWAFQTQPKRPLALTSSSCRGLRPTKGEGGAGPGSWMGERKNVRSRSRRLKSPLRCYSGGDKGLIRSMIINVTLKWWSKCVFQCIRTSNQPWKKDLKWTPAGPRLK